MGRLRFVPFLIALFGAVRPGQAQDLGGWPPSPVCYEDVSRDGCQWFIVTELSGFYALSGFTHEYTFLNYDGSRYTNRWRSGRLAGQGGFGVMRNRGLWAFGGSVSALWSSNDNPALVALLRARRWVGPQTGVDLALGPRLAQRVSLIGEVWYQIGDVVAFGLQLDLGADNRRLALGLRLGSYAGLLGGIAALVAAPFSIGK